jgi:hypothetical protein
VASFPEYRINPCTAATARIKIFWLIFTARITTRKDVEDYRAHGVHKSYLALLGSCHTRSKLGLIYTYG